MRQTFMTRTKTYHNGHGSSWDHYHMTTMNENPQNK